MTIQYNSNNPTTGFDATTAGSTPSGITASRGSLPTANTTPTSYTGHAHTLSGGDWFAFTSAGLLTDCEICASQIAGIGGSTFSISWFDLVLRTDLTATNLYYMQIYPVGGDLRLLFNKGVAGSFSNIAFVDNVINGVGSSSLNLNARFQMIGSTLNGKIWLDGTAEPGWQLTVTDTDLASGYAGLLQESGDTPPVTAGVTDVTVNDTPSGASTSLTIATPVSQIAAGATVSGTYSGTAPTGLKIALDGATSYTTISSPTISGGNFSFAMPSITTGYHQFDLQSAGAPTITAATPSFEGTGVSAVSVALTMLSASRGLRQSSAAASASANFRAKASAKEAPSATSSQAAAVRAATHRQSPAQGAASAPAAIRARTADKPTPAPTATLAAQVKTATEAKSPSSGASSAQAAIRAKTSTQSKPSGSVAVAMVMRARAAASFLIPGSVIAVQMMMRAAARFAGGGSGAASAKVAVTTQTSARPSPSASAAAIIVGAAMRAGVTMRHVSAATASSGARMLAAVLTRLHLPGATFILAMVGASDTAVYSVGAADEEVTSVGASDE